MQENRKWLPHYVDAVPLEARRKKTSMYVIALEAWRRGITLKFYNHNEDGKFQIRYSLGYNGRVHHFQGSKGDKVSEEAYDICNNKGLTNDRLVKAGVPTPQGRKFAETATNEEIFSYANKLEYPLVVKPTNGCAGKGVIANIETEKEFVEAVKYVREQLNFPEIIVEQFVTGEEIRIYVLGDKVLGAANRRPANIVGDGVNTVRQLIRIKNKQRKDIPHLYFRPIKMDKEVLHSIEAAGYTLESVPKEGKRIYLRKISNVSAGGDPIDVTDQLTDELKEIAVNAVKAVPGLVQCGVDMIVNPTFTKGVILELNTKAGIGSHLYPIEGEAKDIPKAIIDYYFPETKGMDTESSNVFFDFKSIVDSLQSRSVIDIEVAPVPAITWYAKKYTILGPVNMGIKNIIKKQALDLDLNGYIQKINKNEMEVVVAGTNEAVVDGFKEKLVPFSNVDTISEETYKKPIKKGFEIVNRLNAMTLEHLEDELNMLKKEIDKAEKDRMRYEKRVRNIKQSTSWKLTLPLRKLSMLIRGFFKPQKTLKT
ncbi:ATP-grasp domain-containing protein [Alkalihalobacterium elongatum]|uniref:ATP-grasp domain-containing protein n=1 Tax=Alkalihalobacterium elongatum TaxID=2675466 RepID=UPI001C1F27A9|nr:ATP-grasp domain-containing protein [Alkalihalobacterium elongatum]